MTRTVQQLFDLSGKTALVTGGSRGLGLQMAHALGEAGAKVLLTSRKANDLQEAAAELKAAGIEADWIAADCADEADIDRLAQEAVQRLGHVDILINNAGASWGSPAEDHPTAAWDKVMNLNVRGYFLLAQQVGKKSMLPRKKGAIVNVSSIATRSVNRVPYGAAKGGVNALTACLAFENGERGIRVNAVAPGGTEAPARRIPRNTAKQSKKEQVWYQEIVDQTVSSTLMKRYGTLDEQAAAILFLASDEASYITGTVLPVGGGDQG